MRILPLALLALAFVTAWNLDQPLFELSRGATAQAQCDAMAAALAGASAETLFLSADLAAALGERKLPVSDPWGTPYRMEHAPDGSLRTRSAGPDRVFDSTDDVFSHP